MSLCLGTEANGTMSTNDSPSCRRFQVQSRRAYSRLFVRHTRRHVAQRVSVLSEVPVHSQYEAAVGGRGRAAKGKDSGTGKIQGEL